MRSVNLIAGRVALLRVLSSAMAVWLTLLCAAQAHELRPSVTDVEVGARQIVLEVEAAIEPFLAGIDQSAILNTNDAPETEEHDRLRALPPAELSSALEAAWPEIAEGFNVTSGGAPIALELESVEVPEVGDVEEPRDSRLVLRGALPEGTDPVVVGWSPRFGALVLRQGDAETGYSAFLTNGDVSAPLPRDAIATESLAETFTRYLISGFDHIIPKGLDHILFVLGLFLYSLRWRPLLVQVTAFTLAHTVTLALATLGVFSLPSEIVEPLIALSIFYIAVENIFFGGPDAKIGLHRTLIVFAFGLLHGLGFASVLEEFGLGSQLVTALIAFNVGVELGQLAVIAIAFVLLGLPFGRRPFYRRFIAIPGSVIIGAVGLWWTIERIFL